MKTVLEERKFDHLEMTYFLPGEVKKEMEDSVNEEYVRAYLEVTGFRRPVYMITGLKIARGSVVETSLKKENGSEMKVGVNLAAVGAAVELGPKGSWKNDKESGAGWSKSTDYIFAYRLSRIKSKKDGSYSAEEFNKGAVFGKDSDEEEDTFEQQFDMVEYEDEVAGISEIPINVQE